MAVGAAPPKSLTIARLLELDAERPRVDQQRLAHRWLGARRGGHARGHDAEGPVSCKRSEGDARLLRDDVERLVEGLVVDVEVESRIGGFLAIGLAKVGDGVAGTGSEAL